MVEQSSRFIEFSKPFIEAAKNIFETMVFSSLKTEKPEIKKGSKSKGDISAVIGLSGELQREDQKRFYQAQLVISWPYQTYIKCANAMLMEEFEEYNDEIADVGGEICNMIVGNAKRDLANLGYTSNMAIPSMVEGPNHSINYPSGVTIILIPLSTEHGELFMEICYKEES